MIKIFIVLMLASVMLTSLGSVPVAAQNPTQGGAIPVSSIGQLGQRQSRDELSAEAGIKPLGRIGNRISNRVESRINSRTGVQSDEQTIGRAIKTASDQARTRN